jgi:type VI secretion system secreted protein VgrG
MANVSLSIGGDSLGLVCTSLAGRERLGDPLEFDVVATSEAPLERGSLIGKPCVLDLEVAGRVRRVAGVVSRAASAATSHPSPARSYRITVRSWLGALDLRRQTRVFQHLSVPAIVEKVVGDSYGASNIKAALLEDHPEREYVVQYAETDAAFVRRLCEEEGLYFRFEPGDAGELFLLDDTSGSAPKALSAPLPLVDDAALGPGREYAHDCRLVARRTPGKVTLRDYNQEKPAVKLEASTESGTDIEKGIEVYEAPGRFADPEAGLARATVRLQSLRAEARVFTFRSTAVALAPGLAVSIEPTADYVGTARPEGDHFVVEVRHSWSGGDYALLVDAIPLSVPFRLPRRTPRPRIEGLHSAIVTGAPGEEIHVDDQGRVRVRFHWDRDAPTDDKSSLPIRVVQPNTPGSMLLPRVGWEVLVAFEDGDPDRPYVLGRAFNQKSPPPFGLPANKTVTALGSSSSPGGGKQNQLVINDGAGSQTLTIAAASGKSTSVASNMVTQTVNSENLIVGASQVRSVGANEKVSVTQAYVNELGSQAATVGGLQKVYVKGDLTVDVGSETVLVGGAVLEKVGNPAAGALNLASAAALAGAGALGSAGGVIAQAAGLAKAGYEGYQSGGAAGAAAAVGMGAVGAVANSVPGGGAALGAVAAAVPSPWSEPAAPAGPSTAAGGAAGASDAAGAKGPGPGHRNTIVDGAMAEIVGGAYGVVSPGSVGWTSVGPSTLLVGGLHSVKASTVTARTLGASTELLGSLSITTAGTITRDVKGALNTTIGGSLTSSAGAKHSIKAGAALNLTIGGALTMKGSNVSFICGSSKVSASPGGVLVEATTVTITGTTKQKGGSGTK